MQKQMYDDKRDLTNMVITRQKEITRRIEKFCKSIPGDYELGFRKFEIRPNGVVLLWNETETGCVEYKTRYALGEIVAVAQPYKNIIDESDWAGMLLCKDTAGWTNKMFVEASLMKHQIKITDIKIERLQDISNKDCVKEGVFKHMSQSSLYWTFNGSGNRFFNTPKEAYSCMIDLISGKGTWNENPYVVAYSFELIK